MHKGFESILGANKNWWRWSDMVAVMFPAIVSHERTFKKVSVRVLEWLVSVVGCKIYGMIEFTSRESRKSLVGCCYYSLTN